MLNWYYYYSSQVEAFEETKAQLEAWPDIVKQFEEESLALSLDDHYVSHDLSPEEVEALSMSSVIKLKYLKPILFEKSSFFLKESFMPWP